MQNRKFLWLLFLWIGAAIQSHAQNADHLYVQAPTGATQSFELENLRKITFTSDDMQVHPTNGSVATVRYDDIAKLTFTSQQASGIEVPIQGTVKVCWEASTGNVMVKSPTLITTITLFDLQGVMLRRLPVQSTEAVLSMPARPAGIYILQVSNEQGVSVHKIIKR